MSKPFNLICGVMALLCVLSMYVPIIAPAGAAMYCSVAGFAFHGGGSVVARAGLSLDAVLLIYWAFLSFRGAPGAWAWRHRWSICRSWRRWS